MAVVGLLEHLCSLVDTQPSEVTPLFFEFTLAKIQSRNAGQGWSSVKKLFVVRLSAAISATCFKMLAPEENAGSSIYPLKSAALFLWPAILRRSHHCTHAVLLHTHIL